MKEYGISAENVILSKVRYTEKDMKLLKSRGLNLHWCEKGKV
jgi:hypothetical protein